MGKEFNLEAASSLAEGISYVVEYITFILFIYEEAMQINNSLMLQAAKKPDKHQLIQLFGNIWDPAFQRFAGTFINYGIIAIYMNNAYCSFLYASMMCREVGQLAFDGKRLQYDFPRIQY